MRNITSCITVKTQNRSCINLNYFFFLGVNFDFFGIGEFWGCKSVQNDFGLQFRFYYYERASLIGGVGLKAGKSVVTVMTIKTENAQATPMLRYVSLTVSLETFTLYSYVSLMPTK